MRTVGQVVERSQMARTNAHGSLPAMVETVVIDQEPIRWFLTCERSAGGSGICFSLEGTGDHFDRITLFTQHTDQISRRLGADIDDLTCHPSHFIRKRQTAENMPGAYLA